jgi:hypothetical protein
MLCKADSQRAALAQNAFTKAAFAPLFQAGNAFLQSPPRASNVFRLPISPALIPTKPVPPVSIEIVESHRRSIMQLNSLPQRAKARHGQFKNSKVKKL